MHVGACACVHESARARASVSWCSPLSVLIKKPLILFFLGMNSRLEQTGIIWYVPFVHLQVLDIAALSVLELKILKRQQNDVALLHSNGPRTPSFLPVVTRVKVDGPSAVRPICVVTPCTILVSHLLRPTVVTNLLVNYSTEEQK